MCHAGKIAALRPAGTASGRVLDALGCLVLPGIVDIHGDAFERQMMPRPGVNVALDVARMLALTAEELAATDTVDAAIDAIASSPLREIVLLDAHFHHPAGDPRVRQIIGWNAAPEGSGLRVRARGTGRPIRC